MKIVADQPGTPLEAEHQFEVIQRDLEAMEPLANYSVLRRMAAASGGRFATIDKMPSLLEQLRIESEARTVTVVRHEDIAASMRWYVTIVLMALLCGEWALRKRKGLV